MSETAKPCKTCGTCPTCGNAPAPIRFVPVWPYAPYAQPWWGINPPNMQGGVVYTAGTINTAGAGGVLNGNTTYTVNG